MGELVDATTGEVRPEAFEDEGIHRLELTRVFARCWGFLGHESQIPGVGDLLSTCIGEREVTLFRRASGRPDARLGPAAGTGNVVVLDERRRERRVRVETFCGLVFGVLDPAAPPLTTSLAGATEELQRWFGPRTPRVEVLDGIHKWEIAANWKLVAKEFSSEAARAPTRHRSSHDADDGGHESDGGLRVLLGDAIQPYWESAAAGVSTRRRADAPIAGAPAGHITVFPNFSYLPSVRMIRVWHPRGPHLTELWAWALVESDTPPEVKATLRIFNAKTLPPAGRLKLAPGRPPVGSDAARAFYRQWAEMLATE